MSHIALKQLNKYKEGYVYKIENAQGVDINKYYGKYSPFQFENEVSIIGPVPPEKITFIQKVKIQEVKK